MPPYPMLLKEIGALGGDLFQKDFLLTWEKSVDEIKKIVAVAEALRWLRARISPAVFRLRLAVSIFRDAVHPHAFFILRAANLLGLGVQDLDEGRSQISHGETVRERPT